jgi:acyl-CoA thioesterase I
MAAGAAVDSWLGVVLVITTSFKRMNITKSSFGWVRLWIFLAAMLASVVSVPAESVPAEGQNPATKHAGVKTIVVLGDSLAAGLGLDPSEAFPALLQKKIDAAGLGFKVVNAGVSGDTTAGGLRRINWLLKSRIDLLVVELGGNDGLRGISPEATKTNLQMIIDNARQKHPQLQVVIAGMQMPPNMGEEYNLRFRRIFPDLAKRNDAVLIPFLLEGVGGRPELNQPDRIHPNAEGSRIVTENVWKILKPVLEKMDESKR